MKNKKIYQDRAGNTAFLEDGVFTVRNREGQVVNKSGIKRFVASHPQVSARVKKALGPFRFKWC